MIGLPDIVYMLNAFAAGADAMACYPNADLCNAGPDPCGGDGAIDLADIMCILQAFRYWSDCPSECPCL